MRRNAVSRRYLLEFLLANCVPLDLPTPRFYYYRVTDLAEHIAPYFSAIGKTAAAVGAAVVLYGDWSSELLLLSSLSSSFIRLSFFLPSSTFLRPLLFSHHPCPYLVSFSLLLLCSNDLSYFIYSFRSCSLLFLLFSCRPYFLFSSFFIHLFSFCLFSFFSVPHPSFLMFYISPSSFPAFFRLHPTLSSLF